MQQDRDSEAYLKGGQGVTDWCSAGLDRGWSGRSVFGRLFGGGERDETRITDVPGTGRFRFSSGGAEGTGIGVMSAGRGSIACCRGGPDEDVSFWRP